MDRYRVPLRERHQHAALGGTVGLTKRVQSTLQSRAVPGAVRERSEASAHDIWRDNPMLDGGAQPSKVFWPTRA